MLSAIWDLSSPTADRTHTPCVGITESGPPEKSPRYRFLTSKSLQYAAIYSLLQKEYTQGWPRQTVFLVCPLNENTLSF